MILLRRWQGAYDQDESLLEEISLIFGQSARTAKTLDAGKHLKMKCTKPGNYYVKWNLGAQQTLIT